MLSNSNIIWSKGFLNNFYSSKKTEQKSIDTDIIRLIKSIDDTIYIRNGSSSNVDDLNIFSKNLNLLNKPCILITSDGDRNVPSSYNKNIVTKILSHKMIKKWYTQYHSKTAIDNIFPKLMYNYWIV